jgi:hypothetical protein
MELKHALAVCLISMFSATLVLLIARALDLQAASRLEPQLVRIVEELEAIRKQGGIAIESSAGQTSEVLHDGIVVYYFHGNVRCVTCRAIETQSHETIQNVFDSELADGRMVWKTLNYEEPSGSELAKQFEIQVPVVVLAQTRAGQIGEWNRLDRVWALVNDKKGFADYVETEIRKMLTATPTQPETSDGETGLPIPDEEPDTPPGAAQDNSELPIPREGTSDVPVPEEDTSDLPVPDESSDIPIPD